MRLFNATNERSPDGSDDVMHHTRRKGGKSLALRVGHRVESDPLFEFQDELPGSPPAALSLVDALVVQEHALQGLGGGRRLLGAGVLGHFLHQDVVARVGMREDAAGILGFGQSLARQTERRE